MRVEVLFRGRDDAPATLCAGLVGDAGHSVVGPRHVEDIGLGPALTAAAAQGIGCVVVTGNRAFPEPDPVLDSGLIEDAVPGFDALFHTLVQRELGSEALRMRAAAGTAHGVLVVMLPHSDSACRVALEELVLPELGDLAVGGGESAEPTPEGGFQLLQMDEEAPIQDATPWMQQLSALGGSLDRDARTDLPPSIAKSAPVLEVLNTAGERGVVILNDESYGCYGFPDLRRANAKVLLIGPGEPVGEVVALHRMPAKIGVSRRGGGLLHSTGRLGRTCEEVTGGDYPENGRLFAVDTGCVYVREGDQVYSWDGRNRKLEGSPQSVLATLLLGWSTR